MRGRGGAGPYSSVTAGHDHAAIRSDRRTVTRRTVPPGPAAAGRPRRARAKSGPTDRTPRRCPAHRHPLVRRASDGPCSIESQSEQPGRRRAQYGGTDRGGLGSSRAGTPVTELSRKPVLRRRPSDGSDFNLTSSTVNIAGHVLHLVRVPLVLEVGDRKGDK